MGTCVASWTCKSGVYSDIGVEVAVCHGIPCTFCTDASIYIVCLSCPLIICKPLNCTSCGIYRFHSSACSIAILNLTYSLANLFCPVQCWAVYSCWYCKSAALAWSMHIPCVNSCTVFYIAVINLNISVFKVCGCNFCSSVQDWAISNLQVWFCIYCTLFIVCTLRFSISCWNCAVTYSASKSFALVLFVVAVMKFPWISCNFSAYKGVFSKNNVTSYPFNISCDYSILSKHQVACRVFFCMRVSITAFGWHEAFACVSWLVFVAIYCWLRFHISCYCKPCRVFSYEWWAS